MTKESRPPHSSNAQKTRAPKSPPWDAPPEPKRSGSQMPMTDETSSTRSVPPHVESAGRDGDLSTLREASDKALRVYELLASEKEGAGLNQAMTQAMHLDRGQMSALEARSIDDRAAGMKRQLAEAARSSGESAFRRQDWKAASQDL